MSASRASKMRRSARRRLQKAPKAPTAESAWRAAAKPTQSVLIVLMQTVALMQVLASKGVSPACHQSVGGRMRVGGMTTHLDGGPWREEDCSAEATMGLIWQMQRAIREGQMPEEQVLRAYTFAEAAVAATSDADLSKMRNETALAMQQAITLARAEGGEAAKLVPLVLKIHEADSKAARAAALRRDREPQG